MNKLFLISGIIIFVLSTLLITNTSNTTMAYICNSSSSTHNVNSQTGLTGSSGGCAVSSSAATTSSHNGSAKSTGSGPNNTVGLSNDFNFAVAFNRPGHLTGSLTLTSTSRGVGTTSSASSGGSQASCSSSSATSVGGAVTSSSSQSRTGSCP